MPRQYRKPVTEVLNYCTYFSAQKLILYSIQTVDTGIKHHDSISRGHKFQINLHGCIREDNTHEPVKAISIVACVVEGDDGS